MAGLVRIGFTKLPATNGSKAILASINLQAVRTITSKLDDLPPKPKPWNYNEKTYTKLHSFFDRTSSRFDENTKLIVVDGPVASGKSNFAKEIAKSFGMFYFPEANLDMKYINKYGYDLKQLDSVLPPDCRSFDVMDFLKHPRHKLVARMQLDIYSIKYSQYIDALAHLLSTGQGVVLDRSVYSDFVFVEAMFNQRYISRAAYKKYYEFRNNSLFELLKPHLIIYLDVPVPKVLENIQKRNISYEVNSPALSPQYLEAMEKHYKLYLKEMSNHSELLVYDWSEKGDTEIVIEDIEAIDFNKYEEHDPQLQDWEMESEEELGVRRNLYADRKDSVMANLNIPEYDCPEIVVDAEDVETYYNIINNAPGEFYEPGYNKEVGDSGFLFKMSTMKRDTLPLRERRQ